MNDRVHLSDNKAWVWFCLICVIHLLFWTLVPYFVRGCLPFDTAESVAWGQQWALGYNKHPPLAAWTSAVAFNLGGVFGLYLLAQIAIIVSFWAIWKLALRMLTPALALLSVVLLEGNLSLTLVSPNYNPTAILVPLWALTFLCFHVALKKEILAFREITDEEKFNQIKSREFEHIDALYTWGYYYKKILCDGGCLDVIQGNVIGKLSHPKRPTTKNKTYRKLSNEYYVIPKECQKTLIWRVISRKLYNLV